MNETTSIIGMGLPRKIVSAEKVPSLLRLIAENGLEDVFTVEEASRYGVTTHLISAGWSSDDTDFTALNFGFATAVANIFASPELKDLDFRGEFAIDTFTTAGREAYAVIVSSDGVFHQPILSDEILGEKTLVNPHL